MEDFCSSFICREIGSQQANEGPQQKSEKKSRLAEFSLLFTCQFRMAFSLRLRPQPNAEIVISVLHADGGREI